MKLYHVLTDGVHPNNRWTRRSDGLYELSGSVYAFADSCVRECTAANYVDKCQCDLPVHVPSYARTS